MRLLLAFMAIGLLLFGCTGGDVPSNETRLSGGGNGPTVTAGLHDCGTSMDCFINSSRACKESKVEFTQSIDFMGLATRTTSLLAINSTGSGATCSIYMKTLDSGVSFSEAAKSDLKKDGKSDAEISAAEAQWDSEAKKSIGRDGTCVMPRENLTGMLTRWGNGSFSTNDYRGASCTGSMFGSSSEGTSTSDEDEDEGAESDSVPGIVEMDGISFTCPGGYAVFTQSTTVDGKKTETKGCQDGVGNKASVTRFGGSESDQLRIKNYADTFLVHSPSYSASITQIHDINGFQRWGMDYTYKDDAGATIEGELISYYCSSNRHIITLESAGADLSAIRSSIACEEIQPPSEFGYELSSDPYPGTATSLLCEVQPGTENPATPDRVVFTTSRKANQIERFGRYFVNSWDSYCLDDIRVYNVYCNSSGSQKLESCPMETSCVNGQCIPHAESLQQTLCEDKSGAGGMVEICDGYKYTHTSGIIVKPHVKYENHKWVGTVEVINGANVTEYEPVISGTGRSRYFTAGNDTIQIEVWTFGGFEQHKYAMVLEIESRYGLDPAEFDK